jgi:cell division protein FtsQ
MNRRRVAKEERAARSLGRARRVAIATARVTGALVVAGAVSVGAYTVWKTLRSGSQFSVRSIVISGNSRATTEELSAACDRLHGVNIFRTDLASVARELEQHPWVARARVAREFPDTIRVVVEERTAAALVSANGLYAVDANGVPFKPATAKDHLDLPVISGLTRDGLTKEDGTPSNAIRTALHIIASYGSHTMAVRAPLSEIRVVEEAGETSYVAYCGDDAVEVRLGVISSNVEKDVTDVLTRLERVWVDLAQRNARPRMLDLGNRQRPDWVPARFESPQAVLGKEGSKQK